jgi:hypothetical protein
MTLSYSTIQKGLVDSMAISSFILVVSSIFNLARGHVRFPPTEADEHEISASPQAAQIASLEWHYSKDLIDRSCLLASRCLLWSRIGGKLR